MKDLIFRFLALLLRPVSSKIIILESRPDIADNTKSVYDEFIVRGINNKYRLVWLCEKEHSLQTKNVITIKKSNKWLRTWYILRAKCIISCNSYIERIKDNQISIYLGHGIAMKSMNTYKIPSKIDYLAGLSKETNGIMSNALGCPEDKFIITGYPRNDQLLKRGSHECVRNLFGGSYKKVIVWYPTFRQHINTKVISATTNSLPIIHSKEEAAIINEYAYNHSVLIVLKPHFSQDLSYLNEIHLSNIMFISDDFFVKNNISSYEFVGGCDALITDYSSIYFDYLLCDKPIGAIWEDIEEYKSNRGFCVDIDFYMKGAIKIYNTDDFIHFLNEIQSEQDSLKSERHEINDLVNYYQDSNSTKRVVDFIEKQL